jgi:hypothetical protein
VLGRPARAPDGARSVALGRGQRNHRLGSVGIADNLRSLAALGVDAALANQGVTSSGLSQAEASALGGCLAANKRSGRLSLRRV